METTDIQAIEASVREARSRMFASSARRNQPRPWCTMLGPPGAGKTTLLDKLVERNRAIRVSGSALTEVADQASPLRHYFEKAFGGQLEYFLHFQLEMLTKRVDQSLVVSQSGGIVDGSICSTYAYSRSLLATGRLTRDEYWTFYSWYLVARSLVGYPTYVIYCHCSTDELRKRIDARSRPHEQERYSNEYLGALNSAFASIASDYENHASVIGVDTEISQLPNPEEERRIVSQCQCVDIP